MYSGYLHAAREENGRSARRLLERNKESFAGVELLSECISSY